MDEAISLDHPRRFVSRVYIHICQEHHSMIVKNGLSAFYNSVSLVPNLDLTCLSPPVIFLLTVARRYFFCGSFFVICASSLCLCHTVLSVSCSLVVTCWEKDELLALVLFYCVLSLSYTVSWVRCGT